MSGRLTILVTILVVAITGCGGSPSTKPNAPSAAATVSTPLPAEPHAEPIQSVPSTPPPKAAAPRRRASKAELDALIERGGFVLFRSSDGAPHGVSHYTDLEFLAGDKVRTGRDSTLQLGPGRYRIDADGDVVLEFEGSSPWKMRLWRDERSLVLTSRDETSDSIALPYRAIHPLEGKERWVER
jgi:hypothetical protein